MFFDLLRNFANIFGHYISPAVFLLINTGILYFLNFLTVRILQFGLEGIAVSNFIAFTVSVVILIKYLMNKVDVKIEIKYEYMIKMLKPYIKKTLPIALPFFIDFFIFEIQTILLGMNKDTGA